MSGRPLTASDRREANLSRTAGLHSHLRNMLPAGTLSVGGGLLALGASTYGFLAISARALGPARFASLSVLWVLVYTAGPGLFLPLEQETARAVAARRAHGLGGRPVLLRAAVLGGGLLGALALAVAAAHRPLLAILFDGDGLLLVGLMLSILGVAAASLYRGALAGTGHFGRYGGQLALEGGLRVVGCALLATAAVRTAGPYGILVGIAPALTVLLLLFLRSPPELLPAGPPASWSEMSGALALLLGGSLLSQSLVNAGPVLVQALATGPEHRLAGQFLAGLVVARVPLFLFAAVQAALLPGLAALASAGRLVELRAGLRRSTALVATLAAAGSLGTFLVGPEVVRLFFGAAYGLGRLDLLCLAIASGAYMLAVVWAQGLIALHGHGLAATGWLVGVAVHLLVTAAAAGLLARVELGFLAGAAAAAATLAMLLQRRSADRLRETAAVSTDRRPSAQVQP